MGNASSASSAASQAVIIDSSLLVWAVAQEQEINQEINPQAKEILRNLLQQGVRTVFVYDPTQVYPCSLWEHQFFVQDYLQGKPALQALFEDFSEAPELNGTTISNMENDLLGNETLLAKVDITNWFHAEDLPGNETVANQVRHDFQRKFPNARLTQIPSWQHENLQYYQVRETPAWDDVNVTNPPGRGRQKKPSYNAENVRHYFQEYAKQGFRAWSLSAWLQTKWLQIRYGSDAKFPSKEHQSQVKRFFAALCAAFPDEMTTIIKKAGEATTEGRGKYARRVATDKYYSGPSLFRTATTNKYYRDKAADPRTFYNFLIALKRDKNLLFKVEWDQAKLGSVFGGYGMTADGATYSTWNAKKLGQRVRKEVLCTQDQKKIPGFIHRIFTLIDAAQATPPGVKEPDSSDRGWGKLVLKIREIARKHTDDADSAASNFARRMVDVIDEMSDSLRGAPTVEQINALLSAKALPSTELQLANS